MAEGLILIVEDELQIADILDAYFTREGFRVVTARDGEVAIQHHHMMAPDLVILDVKLPKKDGYQVLAHIRGHSDTPVIMVTALGEDLEKLSALKMGADDYVVKPFNPLEVVARAQAVLRRAGGVPRDRVLRIDQLEIDITGYSARVVGADKAMPIDLTLTEFRILAHMARTSRKVFTRGELLDACLPEDGDAMERTVDSHISKLRRKLEAAGIGGFLEGVRGVGYRLLPI